MGLTLAAAIAELQTQVTALASASVQIQPGGMAAMIQAAAQIVAALQAAAAAGVTPPSVSFQGSALIALQARLEALLQLQAAASAAGLHAFTYQGRADDFGPELGAGLEGALGVQGSDATAGLVLAATAPAAVQTLKTLFVH